MILSLFNTMALVALLECQVKAVSLRIYTPADRDYGILTLKEDWTIDSTTRDQFIAQNEDYAQRTIPKGDDHMFALTGLMEWKGNQFDKRAFWMVNKGSAYRSLAKVRFF
jgi:hypothetical protein